MSVDPADRTHTLAPRGTAEPEADADGAGDGDRLAQQLPVDDPDRYELIGEHARGGLGRVVQAIDKRLQRRVAVKELLRRDGWHEARFVREALITARLEHPGIVPVHEAGRWPNGDPYYVMKLVEGRTLKELFAAPSTMRDRLRLLPHVIAIADAVGYAHAEGVIHRDLKPSNVIVGEFGETIVIDWGLARDRRQPNLPDLPEPVAAVGSASTISGKVIGTPAYMAPEQARGDNVDERADVYAIGAVLYELLAGTQPHADTTPEAVLERVLAGPPTPLPKLAGEAPGELVDIVQKAMARAATDRYANAIALAEDLRRFQTGQLVSAHAYTPWQRLRKRLAAHRGVVAVAIASAVVLAVIGVESVRSIVAERDIARSERARADSARAEAVAGERTLVFVQAATAVQKDPTAAIAWLKRYTSDDRDRADVVDLVDQALALGVARHVFRVGEWVFDAQFTPDGKTTIASVADGTVRAFDLATGASRVLARTTSMPEALSVAPDGSYAIAGGTLGDVTLVPIAAGAPRTLVAHGTAVISLQIAANGDRVVVNRESGPTLEVTLAGDVHPLGPENASHMAVAADDWSKRAGVLAPNQLVAFGDGAPRVLARMPRAVIGVAISPSGELVLAHDGQMVWAIAYAGGTPRALAPYRGTLQQVAWSHDHHQIAIVGSLHEALLVDLTSGATRELRGHLDAIYAAQFARDDLGLVTASDDGSARLWSVRDGTSVVLSGHDDDVYRVRLSSDERWAATASLDGSVRIWPIDLAAVRPAAPSDAFEPATAAVRLLREGAPITALDVQGDRAWVQTDSAVATWQLASGVREQAFAWSDAHGYGAAQLSPDGNRLLVRVDPTTLEVRRASGATTVLRGHRGVIGRVMWSRDGDAIYSAAEDGTLRRWDPDTGASTVVLEGSAAVWTFAVARDGRVVAHVGDETRLVDRDGKVTVLGHGPEGCVTSAQFDRAKDRLLVQRCDHAVVLFDGDRQIALPTGGYAIQRMVVSDDGALIAGAMGDRTVRVWTDRGELRAVLKGHTDLVMDLAFSPDGSELASGSYDQTLRVWQLATGRHRVLRGHIGAVEHVAWRSNRELVTGSQDGTLRIWPVPSMALPSRERIDAVLASATSAVIDARSQPTTL